MKNDLAFCPSCGASIDAETDTYCPFCGAPTKTEKKEEKSVTDYSETDVDFPAEQAKPIQTMQPIAAPGAPTGTTYPATTTPGRSAGPQLEIRSFWMWFLLGIVTFGIASIVYLYYNIEDLNKLDQHPKPAGVPSTHTDTSNLLIIVIIGLCTGFLSIIMIIATYMKFEKLHKYVAAHPQRQQTLPISGGKYLLITLCMSFGVGILSYAVTIPAAFIPDPNTQLIVMLVISLVLSLVSLGVSIYVLIQQANWQKAYNERARMLCPGTPEKSL